MAAPPLDPVLWQDALDVLDACDGNVSQAAARLGLARGTYAARLQRAQLWKADGGTVDAPAAPAATPEPDPDSTAASAYADAWRVWERRLAIAKSRYRGPSTRTPDPDRQRVLVLPDLHAPHHHAQMLADILEANRKADICIVMGDVSDSYALSRYDKSHRAPIDDEIAAVVTILETLSNRFPVVKVIRGNHDARLERQLTARLNDIEFVQAIKWMTGGTLDFVQAAAKRFPNVEVCGVRASDGQYADWMMVLGDVVLLHAEKYSRVPGSALRSIHEWLYDNEQMLRLPPDWRVVIQAHTHQLGLFPYGAHRLLVECGCLCLTPGYAVSARVGGRPQRRGYVTFDLVAGKCDVNSIRLHWLDGLEQYADAG